jgi:hypothetical protein
MHRTTSLTLLLVSGALLASRLVSPAASAPVPSQSSAPRVDQPSPAITAVDQQVERLRGRMTDVPAYPPPSRDPFNFGGVPQPSREKIPAVSKISAVPVVDSRPPLPKFVAILSSPEDASPTAVFAMGDDVRFAKVGDDVGAYRIERITADALTLLDTTSQATLSVSLR